MGGDFLQRRDPSEIEFLHGPTHVPEDCKPFSRSVDFIEGTSLYLEAHSLGCESMGALWGGFIGG